MRTLARARPDRLSAGMRLAPLLFLVAGLAACQSPPAPRRAAAEAPRASAPVSGFRVVRRYPHDPSAFTEGLFFRDGQLFE